MTLRPPTRRDWLWPAVLAVSAVLVLVAGRQVLAAPTVAADVAVSARVEPAPPVASPSPTATPTRAPGKTWTTRSAAPRTPVERVAPERLVARSVGLDLPVEPTGVAGNGQMALPDRPTQLGWYRFGAAPRDRQGAVVLGGHVDSARYGAGPLTRAAGLERGDRIDLRGTDGRTTSYEVSDVQRISKADFSPADVFARSGSPVLRLITCGGPYDPDDGYRDNLVVTALPR